MYCAVTNIYIYIESNMFMYMCFCDSLIQPDIYIWLYSHIIIEIRACFLGVDHPMNPNHVTAAKNQ